MPINWGWGGITFLKIGFDVFFGKNESVSNTVIFLCIYCCCSTLILLMYSFFIRKYLVGLWGTLQYCFSTSLKSLWRDYPFSSALKNLKTFSFSFFMKIGKIMPNTKVFSCNVMCWKLYRVCFQKQFTDKYCLLMTSRKLIKLFVILILLPIPTKWRQPEQRGTSITLYFLVSQVCLLSVNGTKH